MSNRTFRTLMFLSFLPFAFLGWKCIYHYVDRQMTPRTAQEVEYDEAMSGALDALWR